MCRKIRCDGKSWKLFIFWGELNKAEAFFFNHEDKQTVYSKAVGAPIKSCYEGNQGHCSLPLECIIPCICMATLAGHPSVNFFYYQGGTYVHVWPCSDMHMQTPREGIPRRGPHALGRLHVSDTTDSDLFLSVPAYLWPCFTKKNYCVRTAAKCCTTFFSSFNVCRD